MADPVPGCEIVVGGAALDPKFMDTLLDVQVRTSLLLPDTALVRLRDPKGELVEDDRFAIGKSVDIKLARTRGTTVVAVFKGEIVAIEPEFGDNDLLISFRAYDKGWRLNRVRKSRTFQNVTAIDMVKAIATAATLEPGTLAPLETVYEFFQQSMETDWEFCWRLARAHNCEFVVNGTTFHFRSRERAAPAATLKWGGDATEGALLSFKPRVSGMGQVSSVTVANHDPKGKQKLTGKASTPRLPHSSDAVKGRDRAVSVLSGGDVTVADRVAETAAEASAVAQSTLDRLASSFMEAEGKTYGDPAIRAGATVKLDNVGPFSGEYVLSETTHRYGGGATKYVTTFRISGRTSHTFRDLLRTTDTTDWAASLVIGLVTNNVDEQGHGRVKVKFPALGDEIESAWARVVVPNAGKGRGMFYMPQVDDEVVVAFEHGDTRRPLVIGSLFNGLDKPPPELVDPGKEASGKRPLFGVKTPFESFVESTQKMTLRSHEKMIVEVHKDGKSGTGEYTLDAKGKVEQRAGEGFKQTAKGAFEIDSEASVTIKGKGSIKVEAAGGITLDGGTVDIKSRGPVNIKGSIINLG